MSSVRPKRVVKASERAVMAECNGQYKPPKRGAKPAADKEVKDTLI